MIVDEDIDRILDDLNQEKVGAVAALKRSSVGMTVTKC